VKTTSIPVRLQILSLYASTGVNSVSTALAAAQLCSGHQLCHPEPSFPDTNRLENPEDLIGDFIDVAKAIAVTIHAQDVVNNVFLGP
jgi:hypothetical protein